MDISIVSTDVMYVIKLNNLPVLRFFYVVKMFIIISHNYINITNFYNNIIYFHINQIWN